MVASAHPKHLPARSQLGEHWLRCSLQKVTQRNDTDLHAVNTAGNSCRTLAHRLCPSSLLRAEGREAGFVRVCLQQDLPAYASKSPRRNLMPYPVTDSKAKCELQSEERPSQCTNASP